MKEHESSRTITPGPIPLRKWLKDRDISSVTGWRMRKRGWLNTITIAGQPYLTAEQIQEFERRAIAGEFTDLKPAGGAA